MPKNIFEKYIYKPAQKQTPFEDPIIEENINRIISHTEREEARSRAKDYINKMESYKVPENGPEKEEMARLLNVSPSTNLSFIKRYERLEGYGAEESLSDLKSKFQQEAGLVPTSKEKLEEYYIKNYGFEPCKWHYSSSLFTQTANLVPFSFDAPPSEKRWNHIFNNAVDEDKKIIATIVNRFNLKDDPTPQELLEYAAKTYPAQAYNQLKTELTELNNLSLANHQSYSELHQQENLIDKETFSERKEEFENKQNNIIESFNQKLQPLQEHYFNTKETEIISSVAQVLNKPLEPREERFELMRENVYLENYINHLTGKPQAINTEKLTVIKEDFKILLSNPTSRSSLLYMEHSEKINFNRELFENTVSNPNIESAVETNFKALEKSFSTNQCVFLLDYSKLHNGLIQEKDPNTLKNMLATREERVNALNELISNSAQSIEFKRSHTEAFPHIITPERQDRSRHNAGGFSL